MFDIEYRLFDKNMQLTSFKTPIFYRNTSAENKDLSAQSLTITLKVGFQAMFFNANFASNKPFYKTLFIVFGDCFVLKTLPTTH